MTTVDWIIVIVIAIYALLGLRRGFVATVAYTFGSLISLFGALYAASRLKEPVGALIAPHMTQRVSDAIPGLDGAVESVSDTWESISGYLQNILTSSGVSLDAIETSDDPYTALTAAISQSVGEAIAYIVVFIVAFFLIKLLIHVIVSALGILTHLPVLHSCNALFGGLLGGVTGLVLCTCVLWALKLFVPAMYSDVGMLSPSVMEETAIARHLVGWNDGVSLFES